MTYYPLLVNLSLLDLLIKNYLVNAVKHFKKPKNTPLSEGSLLS